MSHWLIFTDLDGTLLNHHDYSYADALPALQSINKLGIPLILTTSKTLAEVADLNSQLNNHHPVIVENGAVVAIPENYFCDSQMQQLPTKFGYHLLHQSASYQQIIHFIQQQRQLGELPLLGFYDMSCQQVEQHTGLGSIEASKAQQRLGSEPFLWQGSDQQLATFRYKAEQANLHITRGGRFWHIMGNCTKAMAMAQLLANFRQHKNREFASIACGDSENDLEMLQTADIAIVVRRIDGTHLTCKGQQQTRISNSEGAAGWNSEMLSILGELYPSTNNNKPKE